ncbi:hypothetical protein [Ralstonia phage RP31]|uniref:Uncharacterized protein n=2 Tax=Ripduovirus RP12 TaxID=2560700 RepID=A0A1L7N1D0_9CAUD|nr:hypothetical protein FDH28_gp100 [Ralstonia phage RP12]BAW19074.1 hypothetical protein [Ralstonia phage RP12]BAW19359.1 hypothetical protein [Ralstonia phage RP31]
MNKSELIVAYERFRKQHRLTIKELVLSAGGALLMIGLRKETEDLDLDISEELYDQIKRKLCRYEGAEVRTTIMGEYIAYGDYALHRGISPDKKYVVVNGVCCYSAAEILIQKENIQRPPEHVEKLALDQQDMAKLRERLAA